MSTNETVDHIFRHEYGHLVASLVRKVGIQQIEEVEDAIQWAMEQAVSHWHKTSKPDNPSGWLFRVALRHLLSQFRDKTRQQHLLTKYAGLQETEDDNGQAEALSQEFNDDVLRLLVLTCSEDIPVESQLVFTLKSLCGFSVAELATRLFTSSENIYKRFNRAKQVLKSQSLEIESLTKAQIQNRLPSVHKVLYVLFTEGYLSSHKDNAIRVDLCKQAYGLMRVLLKTDVGNSPQANALLALMLFNLARFDTRENEQGLVLLEQQDREQWDKNKIAQGLRFLTNAASGETVSRYHVEASIAAQHCIASSFDNTRWDKIAEAYALLEQIAPSPIHRLNRAVVIAQWQGPHKALELLESGHAPSWLTRSYHWFLVLADLQYRCGKHHIANTNSHQALSLAPTEHIRKLIQTRLSRYQ